MKKCSNEHAPAGTWWRHHDVTWLFWKHTSQNAINTKLGQYVLGEKKMWISMRQQYLRLHDDVTWHFWKTHFPKCYKHETWSVDTIWKKCLNEHAPAGTWWRHDDVTWLSEKHTFQNAINTKLGQYVLGEKKMWTSIRWQVPDDVMMTSRDISEKHTSQNAINTKLG